LTLPASQAAVNAYSVAIEALQCFAEATLAAAASLFVWSFEFPKWTNYVKKNRNL
jgi:hypothetical protein